jgi:hypothetical protein
MAHDDPDHVAALREPCQLGPRQFHRQAPVDLDRLAVVRTPDRLAIVRPARLISAVCAVDSGGVTGSTSSPATTGTTGNSDITGLDDHDDLGPPEADTLAVDQRQQCMRAQERLLLDRVARAVRRRGRMEERLGRSLHPVAQHQPRRRVDWQHPLVHPAVAIDPVA